MDQRGSGTVSGQPVVDSGSGDLQFYFSGERTLLSWIRTSVSLMALGFVVARFALFLRESAPLIQGGNRSAPEPPLAAKVQAELPVPEPSLWIGIALIFAGVALCAISGREYARFRRRFINGLPYELPSLASTLAVCVGLGVIGTAMAVYLVLLARTSGS